jgi:hypothetical protein
MAAGADKVGDGEDDEEPVEAGSDGPEDADEERDQAVDEKEGHYPLPEERGTLDVHEGVAVFVADVVFGGDGEVFFAQLEDVAVEEGRARPFRGAEAVAARRALQQTPGVFVFEVVEGAAGCAVDRHGQGSRSFVRLVRRRRSLPVNVR